MTAGGGNPHPTHQSAFNWRHRQILNVLNMNTIPTHIPRNMVNSYMWALEYGTLMHQLPKNLATRLMFYRNPQTIYQRSQEIKNAKNRHPNLSYNDAYALTHITPFLPRNTDQRKLINSYKAMKRRGLSVENAATTLITDPLIGLKQNAVNKIKRAWKTFRYSTMLKSQQTNPKFRAKIERYMKSANRSFNKYSMNVSRGFSGRPSYSPPRASGSPVKKRRDVRTQMSALMTELLRKKMRVN